MVDETYVGLYIFNYSWITINTICAAFILNWWICFYILQKHACLQARDPRTVLIACAIYFVFTGITNTEQLMYFNFHHEARVPYQGWNFLNDLSYQAWIFAVYILSHRSWLVYFKIKFTKGFQDREWRLYINPQESNWFLKHKKTYGDGRKMLTPILLPWGITAMAYIAIGILQLQVERGLIIIIQGTAATVFLVTLWCKMPTFDDIWGIRYEMIVLAKLMTFGISTYVVIGLILTSLSPRPSIGNGVVSCSIGTILSFGACCILLWYPLYKFKLPLFCVSAYIFEKRNAISENIELSSSFGRKRSIGQVRENKSEVGEFTKLALILKHKHGFRLFVGHLVHEFAIENLLFFLETQQWLKYIQLKCEIESVKLEIDVKHQHLNIEIAHENMPKSRIVRLHRNKKILKSKKQTSKSSHLDDEKHEHETSASGMSSVSDPGDLMKKPSMGSQMGSSTNTHNLSSFGAKPDFVDFDVEEVITDPWLQCAMIFFKYIINDAYFCINISGNKRHELYSLFAYDDKLAPPSDEDMADILRGNCDSDINVLYHIYDNPRNEVFRLMVHSVRRFEKSDEYQQNFTE